MKIIFSSIILLFFVLVGALAFGANIYIDPSANDPLEDGTEAHPFNNWSDVTAAAGNTYFFKRGTVHRGAILIKDISGSKTNKLILDDYGSSDKPATITSRRRSTAAWSGPDGNGVYSITVAQNWIDGFWVGGTGDEWGGEIKEILSGTPSDSQWESSGYKIYYNPGPGDPSPDDEGFFFEYTEIGGGPALTALFIDNSDWVEVHDLLLTRSRYHGSDIGGYSTYISYYDVQANWNGTSPKYNIANMWISVGNGFSIATGDHIYYYRCTANYNRDNGFQIEHLWSSKKPYEVYLYDGQFNYNGSSGAGLMSTDYGNTEAFFIRSEFAYNGNMSLPASHYSRSGIKIKWGKAEIRNSTIHDNGGAGIEFIEVVGSLTTVIAGNLIYNNNTDDYTEHHGPPPATHHQNSGITIFQNYWRFSTFHIYNNTIANYTGNTQDLGLTVYGTTGNLPTMYLKNNIFFGHLEADVHVEDTTYGTLSFDNNSYSDTANRPSVGQIDWNGTVYNDGNIATWNARSYVGTDAMQDPSFSDPANDDYSLKDSSPCQDAGVQLGDEYGMGLSSSTDWIANPPKVVTVKQRDHGSGWDCGAYVYTGIDKYALSPPARMRIIKR